jgi:hypothetical protein
MAALVFPPAIFSTLYLFNYPNCLIKNLNLWNTFGLSTSSQLWNIQNGGFDFTAYNDLYLLPLRLSNYWIQILNFTELSWPNCKQPSMKDSKWRHFHFPPVIFCNLYLSEYPNCWIQKLKFYEIRRQKSCARNRVDRTYTPASSVNLSFCVQQLD